MKSNQVYKSSEIVFLIILLIGNTLSLYNSFEIFHYQYNRQEDQKQVLNKQFAYFTNGFSQNSFWFFLNLKLGFNLLSELVLFIIISLKVSEQKYKQYYVVQLIMIVIQVFVTLLSIWPFSPHSKYGFDFEQKKKQTLTACLPDPQNPSEFHELVCNFSDSVFYMIKCSQFFIIISFISLGGVSASSFLKNKYRVLEEGVREIRSKTVREKKVEEDEESLYDAFIRNRSNRMINTNTVTLTKIPESIITVQQQSKSQQKKKKVEVAKEDVKRNSKINRPSFWSNSYARTEASLSQNEDSHSETDHSWQPSYITFSNTRQNIHSERTSTYSSQNSYNSYQPPFQNNRNPGINAHKHYLDRSMDDDQLDIEENRQL